MASGILEVLLINAKGIRNNNVFVKMNPYLLIRYGDQELKSNMAQGQGSNPEWNERFTFDVRYPEGRDHIYKLSIRIMDKQKLSVDALVGETTIYVKDVVTLGMKAGKAEIQRKKYRVVLPDKTYAGEISVAVTFTVNVYNHI